MYKDIFVPQYGDGRTKGRGVFKLIPIECWNQGDGK